MTHHIPWQALPAHVRPRVEALLGSRAVHTMLADRGFSPAVAGRVGLATAGRR